MRMITRAIGGAASVLALALAGCATGGEFGTQAAGPVTVAGLKSGSGVVHGGQQPVSGAAIQMYAVGMTGLGSAATALAAQPSYTNAAGQFNFPANWNCTSNTAVYGTNPEIYLVATGGNPGLGGTVNNPALAVMALLGPCSGVNSSTYVSVNEVTTVAAVYSLAPFMVDYLHVGSASANAAGLVNAFRVAGALANSANGMTPGAGLPSNATAPVNEINTLANLLAVCINSDGTKTPCAGLFSTTFAAGGSMASDTIGAALQIARNPGNNVTALYNMIPPASPFQPVLNTTPNDWTIALSYTGGGLNAPAGVAIDASGNAWVANAGGNSITELNVVGLPLTGATGYTGGGIYGAQGIAIDRAGNVWVADTLLSSVVQVNVSGGAIQSSSSFTAGGISGPTSVAIDSQNDVWVANFAGATVTELSNAGVAIGGSPLTAAGTLVNPLGIGVDKQGNVWVTDNSASVVAEFANNQTLLSGAGYSDSGILAPTGIALDASGRAWVAESGTNAVGLFATNGNALLSPPETGGGLAMPAGVAIDGAGTVWVANAGSISQLAFGASAPLSPPTGFGVLNQPGGIAVDGSGNVWTANSGDNTVAMFVGLAAPAVTPIAATAGP